MMNLLLRLELTQPLQNPVFIFTLVLAILLLVPLLCQRLRLPHVVGLILAGVAIGPHGWNILERKGAIELFGTVGLLYIMFLAGLDLDRTSFLTNRKKSLLFGVLTFIVPLGMGWLALEFILDYHGLSSLLIASMFATHTLIAYPIVSKLGIVRKEAVAIAVGGTIITDTAVLLLLAGISGTQETGFSLLFLGRLILSVIGFGILIFSLYPRLGRWFFARSNDDTGAPFIFVLALVFLAGVMAEFAGIEAIVGAFFAGLALNAAIPEHSPLTERLTFVGNTLFIPFFLLSVGMLVDLQVLVQGTRALWVALTLTGVALAGKWVAAWITQRWLGFSGVQRQLLFGLSSAHAAATLAVILVGYRIGLIDDAVLNGTILLILVTCLTAALVTERAGRRIAAKEASPRVTPGAEADPAGERFLTPLANPESASALLALTALLRGQANRFPITTLGIIPDTPEAGVQVAQQETTWQQICRQTLPPQIPFRVATRIALHAGRGISQFVRENQLNAVVMGWSGRAATAEGWLFGTTLDYLLDHSKATLVVALLKQPLAITRRIWLITPPNALREPHAAAWVSYCTRLAQHFAAEICWYNLDVPSDETAEPTNPFPKEVSCQSKTASTDQALQQLAEFQGPGNLFIIIHARRGTLSYHRPQDSLIPAITRNHPNQNLLVIFPTQDIPESKRTNLFRQP
ncbi:MAG: cation:proton antiporter [Lewinellaceae bacterium]|nr:cation:proton antiporter [Lewinellaceae bacterium]